MKSFTIWRYCGIDGLFPRLCAVASHGCVPMWGGSKFIFGESNLIRRKVVEETVSRMCDSAGCVWWEVTTCVTQRESTQPGRKVPLLPGISQHLQPGRHPRICPQTSRPLNQPPLHVPNQPQKSFYYHFTRSYSRQTNAGYLPLPTPSQRPQNPIQVLNACQTLQERCTDCPKKKPRHPRRQKTQTKGGGIKKTRDLTSVAGTSRVPFFSPSPNPSSLEENAVKKRH
ncbi:hypothetical protein B0T19DRAFT_283988 [Cercophora scortea]|uniref:Uncharacterized protein n=1 Tax=Cercophora scortea TaxID=314031 RepID=A0AAE0I9K2_9PEZI|nr:hypothetical protein B0T19DRAFT_283988 [Cercophora scortea]